MTKPLTMSAYARRRGVTPEAVRKAVATGRLRASVVQVRGKPAIGDPELADREWEQHTQPRDGASMEELTGVRVRKETALAELAELDLAERRGELVPAADVVRVWTEKVVAARTQLMGVPTSARERLPHLTVDDVQVLEGLVREVAEELASDASDDD